MEIRHLQTFIAIVELGGFTKAADNLGYAQSTITSHIQLLENELDTALFDRLGKKIVLTNMGSQLVPHAKKMLEIYKEIKDMTNEKDQVTGDLVIGASESLSIYRLGKILKEYKRKYPKVNIILKNSICSDLRKRLYSGEFDVVFTIEPEVRDDNLEVKKLKDETMVIIGELNSDLEFFKRNSEEQVLKENVIFSEKGCSSRISFENYLKQNKIKYVNPLEFSSIEAIKKCVINGLGISILPLYAIKREISEESLKMIELDGNFDKYATQLIYHKNKNQSTAMKKLIEITFENSNRWS
ncbi:transcriptional regulator, LysR family [Clostridium sp. DL-VIII]|uniref:LysR family transcriptional regulator n=1 Tax=Clostridium sp. DL-VIII TaxID=641107 RepID=UPI00023B0327|nr:LysR family transcriptional regulator [Clostridium sp. DL-VIII]EHJ01260.1 transcriptional regulator, LysR family [Clostridium sp. DL-VIII]